MSRYIPGFVYLCSFLLVFLGLGLVGHAAVKQAAPHLLHSRFGSIDPLHVPLQDIVHTARMAAVRPRVVQFWSPVTAEKKDALLGHGLVIRGYIPDHALVVMASDGDAAWLSQLSMVRLVVDEPLSWRLDPRLLELSTAGLRSPSRKAPENLYVELSDVHQAAAVQDAVRALGGAVSAGQASGRVLRVQLAASLIATLAEHPDVLSVEPALVAHTQNDASFGMVQAGAVHRSPVWDRGLHGEGQFAAVCDVGVSTSSCFFPSDKIADYQIMGAATAHDISHGTHVAGSLLGDRLGNGTYDLDDGMAPAARLIVQDAGTQVAGELNLPGDFGKVLLPAYDKGARVHVNSWGIDSNTYTALERSLDAFVAEHRDMLVVVAQGNAGANVGSVGSPATAKNIISVGAYDSTKPQDVASFSAHGPTSDGRIKPTVLAPGVQIASADATVACGLILKSGTSMAAPMVGGAAILVRQYYAAGYYPSGVATPQDALEPSAALVKATLLVGTQNIGGLNTGGDAPAVGQGFGSIKLSESLSFADDASRLFAYDGQAGLQQADVFETTIAHKTAGPLRLALTWMDEPGVQGAQKMLVNDLDLELRDGQGNVYRGNGIAAGASVIGTAADDTNVEEVIVLPQAAAGSYTVTVRAKNVPMGPQPFAVVARGSLDPSQSSNSILLQVDPTAQRAATCNGPTCGEAAASATEAGGCQLTHDNDGRGWFVALALYVAWRRGSRRGSLGHKISA